MNYIEQKMYDVIKSNQTTGFDGYQHTYEFNEEKAAEQCSSIAEELAIEFKIWCDKEKWYESFDGAEWLWTKHLFGKLITIKELYNLFLTEKNE
jgi:hypothetical protein